MASGSPCIPELDLHGLVDGFIEPDRRAEALRRVAGSPEDRARIEAWQDQNDLLRSAFAAIVREPLPPLLDLKPKVLLHCVPANDEPIIAPAHVRPKRSRRQWMGAVATIVVIAAGLWGSFTLSHQADAIDGMPPGELRGSLATTLALRSSEAVAHAAAAPPLATRQIEQSLPTNDIPDLRTSGFGLVAAETVVSTPIAIVFRYQNRQAERVAVAVGANEAGRDRDVASVARLGRAFGWRKGNKVYAIAGTVGPERLRQLASSLQQDNTQ